MAWSAAMRMRALFGGTGVAFRQNALRYNIPKRYAKDVGGAVKLFWDRPSAVEAFESQRHTVFGPLIMAFGIPLLMIMMLPWKYEIPDFIDSIRNPMAEDMAMVAYYFFINELNLQRNRAYEFYRLSARPGNGFADTTGRRGNVNQPNAMSGYQAWDQETGKPIHWYERGSKLDIFQANHKLETAYLTETKADMDRIREIREKLGNIRSEMMTAKQDMYKKAME
eukprot:TRINITY_DN11516_c0_g1_i1.p1 TRINITY_DN11516_c0_g1~~TRINITY_DN11516_c0_g1_i1.p1  ORF type:complete len:224 (+),score=94.23 TRINITY_DN11516_c0_g1_i1:44-715(+)